MPETAGTKRKRPPTFQQFPEKRAKKLKQSWVKHKKIKSKWRREKSREGLVVSTIPQNEESGSDGHDLKDHPSPPPSSHVVSPLNTSEYSKKPKQEEKPGYVDSPAEDDGRDNHTVSLENKKRPLEPLYDWSGGRAERRRTGGKPTKRSQAFDRQEMRGQVDRERQGTGRGRNTVRGGKSVQPDMRRRMSQLLDKIQREYA